MTMCPNCGVELDASAKRCPLCRAEIRAADEPAARAGDGYPDRAMDPEDFGLLSESDKAKVFVEIYTVCSLVACFVVSAVELLMDWRLSWSLYPVAAVAFLYLAVVVPLTFRARPWVILVVLGPAVFLFLFVLDVLSPGASWFAAIGAPIAFVVEAVSVACAWTIARLKRKGVNVIAYALIGVAAVCAGIETTINCNVGQSYLLSWSAVVIVTCLPIATLLFYLHYRITKQASLRKLFHL